MFFLILLVIISSFEGFFERFKAALLRLVLLNADALHAIQPSHVSCPRGAAPFGPFGVELDSTPITHLHMVCRYRRFNTEELFCHYGEGSRGARRVTKGRASWLCWGSEHWTIA